MLEQQPFVHSSAQVGNVLRIMVSIDQTSPADAVSRAIRDEGLHVQKCVDARPGLEDVFVAATRIRKPTS
jgi:hypothetical protein